MTTAHIKRFFITAFTLCFLLIVPSCGPKLPSFELTKSFFGYGVSIKESTKSFTDSYDGFTYSMEVWSLPVSFTKKVTKNFLKISEAFPSYTDPVKSSIRWTAVPLQADDSKYAAMSKMTQNRGITVVQEIEVLLKAVLNEKGNYYSYAVSDVPESGNADTAVFAVFCSQRNLLIVLERSRVL